MSARRALTSVGVIWIVFYGPYCACYRSTRGGGGFPHILRPGRETMGILGPGPPMAVIMKSACWVAAGFRVYSALRKGRNYSLSVFYVSDFGNEYGGGGGGGAWCFR